METLQLYRRHGTLIARGKVDPHTGRVHAKKGMEQFCRETETKYNLKPMSISKTTLNRWQRKGIVDADSVRWGRVPVLPADLEENLIKLVLACDARGDEKASPWLVRRAVGLYIKGTAYEKEFKERYAGRWSEENGIILPGKKWLANWEARMKEKPEYSRVVKCRGRGVDVDKIRSLCSCNCIVHLQYFTSHIH